MKNLEIIDNPISYKNDIFYPINYEPKGDFKELSSQLQRQIRREGKDWNFEEFNKKAQVSNSLFWSKNERNIVIKGAHLFTFQFKDHATREEFYQVNKYNKIKQL